MATTATAAAIKTILGTMTFGAGTSVEVAQQMLQAFGAAGHVELDTAIMYVGGTTERILGDLKAAERFALASKANPKFDTVTKRTLCVCVRHRVTRRVGAWFASDDAAISRVRGFVETTSTEAQRSLSYDKLRLQFELSTAALQTDAIDLYYLHMPDHDTPIEESLRAINSLHVYVVRARADATIRVTHNESVSPRLVSSCHVTPRCSEGKIKRFGMSNYAAWQVMEAHHICKAHGWLTPSVYQGMYNAITREVERELFPCLRRLGIAFYAYNPLAGGMLTGRYNEGDQPTAGRFGGDSFWANAYRARYMQPPQFAALKHISRVRVSARAVWLSISSWLVVFT